MKKTETTASQQQIRNRAQASLIDSLGAVQAALNAMPGNVVSAPRNLADVFLLIDPVLSMLNKQLLEARAQSDQLIRAFGMGDAMNEALSMQIAALEKAYNERLALLRKKREEAGANKKETYTKTAEAGMTANVRRRTLSDNKQGRDAMWLLVLLILRNRRASARKYGLVPSAA